MHFDQCGVECHSSFNLHFPVEPFWKDLLVTRISSFQHSLQVYSYFIIVFLPSFRILDVNPLSDVELTNIFSHSQCCLSTQLTDCFLFPCSTKSHLPIVDPISQAMRVLIKNALPVHVWSYSVPLNFSFGNLRVSGFRLRYFIHFEYLMCRQRDKVYPSFIFLHVNTPFSQYYLLKVYFLKSLFDIFIKKQVFAIVLY